MTSYAATTAAPSGERVTRRMTNALIKSLAVCAVLVAGFFAIDRREEARTTDQAAFRQIDRLTTELNHAKQDERVLQQAIRDQRAIIGMTVNEALMAKGRPDEVLSGPALPALVRDGGGVQMWLYKAFSPAGFVVIGSAGQVITSSDTAGKLIEENSIRQQ